MSEWYGPLPRLWSAVKLKRLVRNVVDQTDTRSADEIYVALENIEGWSGRLVLPDAPRSFESTVKRFDKGDILFAKLRPYLAKAVLADRPGVGVGELLVLRPRTRLVNACFLLRALLSKPFIDVVNSSTFGAKMPRAEWDFIGGLTFPVPPMPEQLDCLTAIETKACEIDRFIANKRRLIALFEEQKRAIVSRAVTRGINPDAPLKPSGLDWLGDIPAHWDAKRAKSHFQEIDERSAAGEEELLSVSHITGVTPRREKNINMFMAESYEGSKLCRPGDLVINTMWAWMGACGVSEYQGIVSPSYGVYRPAPGLFVNSYLDFLARCPAYIAEYTGRSTGITSSRLRLYPDAFLTIPIVRPSLEEQQQIVEAIAVETSTLNRAIRTAEREIELIQEFRTTLISDVVTGKLDIGRLASRIAQGEAVR